MRGWVSFFRHKMGRGPLYCSPEIEEGRGRGDAVFVRVNVATRRRICAPGELGGKGWRDLLAGPWGEGLPRRAAPRATLRDDERRLSLRLSTITLLSRNENQSRTKFSQGIDYNDRRNSGPLSGGLAWFQRVHNESLLGESAATAFQSG